MAHLLLFGLGYSGQRITATLAAAGWQISTTRRQPVGPSIALDHPPKVRAAMPSATHLLSSVPPAAGPAPALSPPGDELATCTARCTSYLYSSSAEHRVREEGSG